MLTVFFSTKADNPRFERYLDENCALETTELYQFINPGTSSLSAAYNTAIDTCETPYLLLIHDDVLLEKGFDKKITDYFEKFPEYAILGVAGTPLLTESGIWWDQKHLMCGQVWHTDKTQKNKKKWLSKYSQSFPGEVMECAIVDGLFMAINLKKLKARFNESIEGFHYYDVAFCAGNAFLGAKIGVVSDLWVLHKSIGTVTPEWHLNRSKFLGQYRDKLPLLVAPHIIYDDAPPVCGDQPPVAVVIPTKDNLGVLKKCLASFGKTNYKNFEIHIADTGSDPETIEALKNLPFKFTLHEYGWWNFAKINNDVVAKLPNSIEYVLFCNDDIELVNDALSHLVAAHQSLKNVGTVGARLHYENGLIQHGGILFYATKEKTIKVTHRGIKTFYGSGNETQKVVGNTAAFMLVKKTDFEAVGGFPHTNECFEDLLLNMNLVLGGKNNIYCGKAVCLHRESTTRGRDPDKIQKENQDYLGFVVPALEASLPKFKKYILGY